jgi:flagellar basal-body rod protein FlgF
MPGFRRQKLPGADTILPRRDAPRPFKSLIYQSFVSGTASALVNRNAPPNGLQKRAGSPEGKRAMDNAMMIGLTRQMTLRRAVDIAANNIANMNTAGFKMEHELLAERPMGRARDVEGGEQIRYVTDWGVLRDFSTGPLQHTGRDFDLAINGEGFFQLQAGDDVQYTRDGRFTLDPTGALVSADGAPVLDDGGAPVIIPSAEDITITSEGAVMADGVEVARVGLVAFDNLSALQKAGEGRFVAPEDAAPVQAETPDIRQGFSEGSNVNPVMEITRMLEISRTYEAVSEMIKQNSDLSRRSVERLGKLQG